MDDRVRSALTIYIFGALGVFLVVAPWSALWDHGTWFLLASSAAPYVRSGTFRGLVSALGILDLAVAVRETASWWALSRARVGNRAEGSS